jgi:hypothetical protein
MFALAGWMLDGEDDNFLGARSAACGLCSQT